MVYTSKPGRTLLIARLVVDAPTPPAALLGFRPLPPLFLALLGSILAWYMLAAEVAKHIFYQRLRIVPAHK